MDSTTTTITLTPNTPMKEIPMNELKNNTDNIPESFKAFLAAGSSVIETCRDLVHVTEIQKDEILRLWDENERLRKENAERTAEPPADYQVLKDFKGEMDAIHEEYDIPKDVRELRSVLDDWKEMKAACDSNTCDPDELAERLEELEAIKSEMEDHNIDDARDLGDCLEEWEDANAYEKGFGELAKFVEKFKELIGYEGGDIPATDVEDYK